MQLLSNPCCSAITTEADDLAANCAEASVHTLSECCQNAGPWLPNPRSSCNANTVCPQHDERSTSKTNAVSLQSHCCSVVKTKADSSQPNFLGASAQA